MKKILCDYDENTGAINTLSGLFVGTALGVEPYEETPAKDPLTVSQITKLKEAGFDAEEIAKLHSKGVV
jgi:hypothetical protein